MVNFFVLYLTFTLFYIVVVISVVTSIYILRPEVRAGRQTDARCLYIEQYKLRLRERKKLIYNCSSETLEPSNY